MQIHLDVRWVKRVRELPEAGMGYHRVDLLTVDGRTLPDVVVLNSKIIELPDEAGAITIRGLQPHRVG